MTSAARPATPRPTRSSRSSSPIRTATGGPSDDRRRQPRARARSPRAPAGPAGSSAQGVRRPPAVGPVLRAASSCSGSPRPSRSTSRRTRSASAASGVTRRPGDLHRAVLARTRGRRPDHAAVGHRVPGATSRRCSGWPSRSTRSTASAPQGTLPRLLSQPIHRDDVINGKFAAGLAVIGLVLVTVVGVIAAFGIIRLGHRADAPPRSCGSCCGSLLTFVYVVAVAGVRDAAVGRGPAGGDVGADRVRGVAAADVLRRA